MPKITPFLWFDNQAEEAARFYVSVFPNSKIVRIMRNNASTPGETGAVLTVDLILDGLPATFLNGGPHAQFSDAFSFMVHCADQAEVDRYWDALIDGGEPSQCGWLKDRYGFSWQITPDILLDLMTGPDAAKASRVAAAMMKMVKLDVDQLKAAAES
jgi:predicted 3-demethylubiquinone-9 3-methyltransferase (glyoxalase superfamily)